MSVRRGVAVLVSNLDAVGGMERQARLLAETFGRLGRRVVVVSTFYPEDHGGLLAGPPLVERRGRVTIYRVPFFRAWHYPTCWDLYETVAAWLLARHATELGAIYGIQALTGGFHAARLGRVLGQPSFVKLACSGEAGDLRGVDASPDPERVLAALRHLDRVVYLNDESRAEALARGIAAERLVHIPNGIDLSPFGGVAATRSTGEERLLFVGRLSRQKRVDVLIEAFAGLARREARLAIVGAGPEREALERLARERGVADRVSFLGMRSDVPALLRDASVFVLPSAEEGISNALLEALAAGVPSVATDIPGNAVVLRHEEHGLLVPVGDVAALTRALDRLLSDRPLAARLAAAGRSRVEAELAIERVAERYLELFDALTAPRTSSMRFLARYATSDLTGFGMIALRGAARSLNRAGANARTAVTRVVVAAKSLLGIERELLPTSRSRP